MAYARQPYGGAPYARLLQPVAAGGGVSFSFPIAAWHWVGNAPVFALAIPAAQKAWVWQPEPPTLGFAIAAAQRGWGWTHNAPALIYGIPAAQKAWNWAAQAPVLGFSVAAARAAWNWAANPAPISGGNLATLVYRFFHPGFKRRRNRSG